jgi:hypothetical protein
LKKQIILLALVLGIIACTNDTGNVSPISANPNAIKHDGSKKDATATTTVYRVKDEILNQFVFYCQLSATSLSTRTQTCAPDAYMMGANSIARFKGNNNYGANATKLTEIANRMGTTLASGTSFDQIKKYLNSYDTNFITASNMGGQLSRSSIKTFIENALENDRFVLVPVNAYVMAPSRRNQLNLYSNNSTNPDLQATNSGASYYITSEKGHYQTGGNSLVGGHWILIIKITIDNASGSGVVEYIDPLADNRSPSSNRKFMNYTRLLDSNKINGNGQTTYDAIVFGVK